MTTGVGEILHTSNPTVSRRDFVHKLVGGASALLLGGISQLPAAAEPHDEISLLDSANWTLPIEGELCARPALNENLLYAAALDGKEIHLYAMDFKRGKLNWPKTLTIAGVSSRAYLIPTKRILWLGVEDKLFGFTCEQGDVIRNIDLGEHISAEPVASGESLYVPVKEMLYELNQQSGESTGSIKLGKNVIARTPAVEGQLYLGTYNGTIGCWKINAERPEWEFPVESPVTSGVAYHDGQLYFGLQNGTLLVLRARDGKTEWSSPLAFGSLIASTPYVVSKTEIYAGGHNGICYRVNPEARQIIWRQVIKGEIREDIVKNGNVVFAVTAKGCLSALDANSGALLFVIKAPEVAPLVLDGMIVTSAEGKLYAARIPIHSDK